MRLVDVHCHLDHPAIIDDIDNIISRAEKAGIRAMVTCGITPRTNEIALDLAKRFKSVYCSLGIYPPDALRREISGSEYPIKIEKFDVDEQIEWIRKKLNTEKVLAIGEVGLDYASEKADKKEQKNIFEKFITLSEKTKKPLIIHSRKAESDVTEMLESSKLKNCVMHCFSGKFKLVKRLQDLGVNFSIPTNVVRSQQFQLLAESTNLSQLFTETDAPYLSPFKEKNNEPSFITESIRKIAEIKKMTEEEISNQMYMNFQRLFL